jgi:hypothetical protein
MLFSGPYLYVFILLKCASCLCFALDPTFLKTKFWTLF